MVANMFEGLEKLSAEERIERLKEIEVRIEKEKQEQIAQAALLIKEAREAVEEERNRDIFEPIKEPNLETEILKDLPKEEELEKQVIYEAPGNPTDDKIEEIQAYGTRKEDFYKSPEMPGASTEQAYVKSQAEETWEKLGYKTIK